MLEVGDATELADSTRHVALASLPVRFSPPSPHAPNAVSDFREFQDGELVPGTRYVVRRLIGTGGMGRVYEVEHIELGKRFVLKALQRELSRREDLVARLRNEWRALARLEHPNIVNVTDAGTSDSGVPFYVMERLEGETLATLMHRQRRLPAPQALGIAAGLLEGLHAAHQIGVVHRDVKPPNVFLTAGAVKILDFGIAKIRDAKDVITARGIAVGTPRYMSPEQAQGTAVDARSDIYATGLILFEMVSGVGPFDDAKDHNQLLLAHLGRKAPLLSSISVVAPELDALVAGMLAKDPRERPASARVVAETLRSLRERYAHFVGTDAPTVDVAPRPAPSLEPPTRVEGPRRSAPAPAATRPDGLAASGRAPSEGGGDTTTLQPAIEVATTAAHLSLPPGSTQRLPHAATTPSFFGPDTVVDPPTQAPTAVPASSPVHTEMLLVAPPAPGANVEADAGPTRTFVPLPLAAEAPNLTPPPVVPNAPVTPPRAAVARRALGLPIAAAFALLVVAGAAWSWRRAEASAARSQPAHALPPSPSPALPPVTQAEAEVAQAPVPPPLGAPATSVQAPPDSVKTALGPNLPLATEQAGRSRPPASSNRKVSGKFLGSLPLPAPKPAAASSGAPSATSARKPTPPSGKAAASMPGSGL